MLYVPTRFEQNRFVKLKKKQKNNSLIVDNFLVPLRDACAETCDYS